ncbi:LAXTG-anchored chaplin ChpA [Kitasatospora saccharophila]|uniref:LAXTG-anchored chaplin ChpA n=1 Tax=Kitasatospora saccharophila TaxID=407973 RepID=A0ABP5J2V3_9ACTN
MRQVARKGLLTAMATGSVLASTAGYAHATADAHGAAVNSPGVGSGNAVQVPVELPVNACGNTINLIGLLNPAYGNDCSNVSAGGHTGGSHAGGGQAGGGQTGGGHAGSGAGASGTAAGSPGVASGNNVQVPIAAPVDACGNSVSVVGLGNPAFGNDCANAGTPHQHQHPTTPPTTTPPSTQPPGHDCPPEQTGGEHGTPPTDRNGGPNGDQPSTPTTPGTTTTVNTPATPATVTQARAAAPAVAGQAQLASTGASGLEVIAPAGIALLLGGGVLYRRSRALARR